MTTPNTYDIAIQNALEAAFDWYAADYPYEMQSNMVPYGDTYVNAGDQPTDEAEEECLESFKSDMSASELVREWLLEDGHFLAYLERQTDLNADELLENTDFLADVDEKIQNFRG